MHIIIDTNDDLISAIGSEITTGQVFSFSFFEFLFVFKIKVVKFEKLKY